MTLDSTGPKAAKMALTVAAVTTVWWWKTGGSSTPVVPYDWGWYGKGNGGSKKGGGGSSDDAGNDYSGKSGKEVCDFKGHKNDDEDEEESYRVDCDDGWQKLQQQWQQQAR